MTAEVVIMNKTAVAMAADSAVTIPTGKGQKIYNTAHKLFKLSRCQPVGIMIYGTAEFMGIPWESLIKIYKESLDDKSFSKLKNYGDDFVKFLEHKKELFPKKEQIKAFRGSLAGFYSLINSNVQKLVEATIAKRGKIAPAEIKTILAKEIDKQYKELSKAKKLPSISTNYESLIIKKHKKDISFCIKEVFEKLPISREDYAKLQKIAGSLFSRDRFPSGTSGIVVAGFGHKDTFPALISYEFHCVVDNKIRYRVKNDDIIDFEMGGIIIPFAQSEVVVEFMEGIDNSYLRIVNGYLSALFSKYPDVLDRVLKKSGVNLRKKNAIRKEVNNINSGILKKLMDDINKYKNQTHVRPITRMVTSLPKEELAMMAESFVNLTSLKRKISDDQETVGGPIDVAIISKGDGFVWVKRKNYFKQDLNQGIQI